jgi:hypothetical protein
VGAATARSFLLVEWDGSVALNVMGVGMRVIDAWGDLDAQTDAANEDALGMLDEEEARGRDRLLLVESARGTAQLSVLGRSRAEHATLPASLSCLVALASKGWALHCGG